MTRDILLNNLCPTDTTFDCWNGDEICNCDDCNRVLNKWLDEYDKQIRADVIDEYKEEVLSRFCECCDQYACNGAMIGSRQECTTICMLRDVCTDIANELKEQNK